MPPQLVQFLRRVSSISATSATRCYSSFNNTDPLLTTLSEAIANNSIPLETSIRTLLPSLKPSHIIHLITTNPHSLSPHALFSFFQWLSTRPPFRHTLQSYFTIITHLSAHHMYPQAQSLLHIIVSQKGKHSASSVFQAFVQTQGRNAKVDLAMQMYGKMVVRGVKADLITFNTLINGLCKSGRITEARYLIDEMTRVGLKADKVTYTSLLDGCCKEGNLDMALGVKEKMVNEGVELDNVTFTALISGLCREGLVIEAEKTLREMRKSGLKTDAATYTMVIDGFCKKGDVKTGFHLLKEMRRDGVIPGVITYNVLMIGLCKLGQLKNANKLLRSMLDLGVLPDDITYNILLDGHCKYGDPELFEKLSSEKGLISDYASYISLVEVSTKHYYYKR
ncbi:putative tetratricopeptide-like helical domain superfamily [Helianthus annuus]|nr:putative tetratricopeptide-like helical domain superfamily [Helianthus annuus]KAJ0656518.1 putative tetratricopeptide-like helical domain superfamily [Helianthus annuus]KAJ0660129.1 putative tetratricopeptide-like helical domain superfamily [Helianthus annuus]